MTMLWPGRGGPAIDYISNPPDEIYRGQKIRNIVILGSTGSIGRNALDVIEKSPSSFRVTGLACAENIQKLLPQALRHRPAFLAVLNESAADRLGAILPSGYRPKILIGPAGYAELAGLPETDLIVCAQMGHAGLPGTLAAALAGKTLALANKESLVLAGKLLRRVCAATGASILPVDSEHFALFQCIAGRGQNVAGLILTASGGPFLGKTREQIRAIKGQDALRHPNWQMGAKISVDSATLMNKGLEFIEALRLYGIPRENLEILIHPQSIVHSLARLADNSLLAQMAVPDMRLPIGGCLLWPRETQAFIRPLDLAATGALTFEKPDPDTFPCLGLALRAAAFQPDAAWEAACLNPACVILSAANEKAVELFLGGKCGFYDIALLVEKAMDTLLPTLVPPKQAEKPESLDIEARRVAGYIQDLDTKARNFVQDWIAGQDQAKS